ncbi:hypothetical protein EVAR_65438_1 [Eumeta japonica]|uniref:Uncharacterized protein n=1 Tax=Eumeta variegata TaxID=151549 RepID=A0A4C1ZEP2_EUMVA|nr:hypothetical protein EVAR_65438_1 [Eumeta japonica]
MHTGSPRGLCRALPASEGNSVSNGWGSGGWKGDRERADHWGSHSLDETWHLLRMKYFTSRVGAFFVLQPNRAHYGSTTAAHV